MTELFLYFFIGLAGLLSFLSPCVLPLVPPYLCYLGGVTFDELAGKEQQLTSEMRARILGAALLFVLGFTVIFVSLGVGASAIGQFLHGHKILFTRIAGVIIILFGLQFLGVFRLSFLQTDTRFFSNNPSLGMMGAFLMGLAFAFGWTPCIGPILAPVLSLAASSEHMTKGASMLFVYSLGLGIPFIGAALAIQSFLGFLKRYQAYLGIMEKAVGGLLVLVGLLFINATLDWAYSWISLNGFSSWLLENFESLQTIEKLLVPDEVADEIYKKSQ